jgi:putative heme-binding domain-containing protein
MSPGFTATLFACDPLIEYPSAIAIGPRPGTLFVAVDYMTGLGTEIVRRDEIRLLEDLDGDGYADKVTVYASGFNSIQGLAYHDGTVYVMNAPFLTALRDRDGDGKADERRDLLTGLGLKPEENPVRLHCANGVVVGHDGWLYLALGDHGCNVPRPEGDRLILQGGGILRCRPDGRDLHVFATGLRNVYDLALDAELNVFFRDNENDGGDYKIRICHSFFGADHGYPYLYYERPDEALRPLADLGLGSSAGAVCYLETGFPAEYRGDLFFCEWGRAVVRCRPKRAGSAFAPIQEMEFAAGAANDPYGFKPTDLVVQRDGSLFVADWADGQRPKRGRGRIYRITAKGNGQGHSPRTGNRNAVAGLDSESYFERLDAQEAIERRGGEALATVKKAIREGRLGVAGRLHAIWILAHAGRGGCIEELFRLVETDPDPRVQAQSVRALADLTDPVLVAHRLDAGPGDAQVARRLAALASGRDARVLLEVIVALGRLRWSEAPIWLQQALTTPDAALAHAAMLALRRSNNWPAVLKLLDAQPLRSLALRALAAQYDPLIVDDVVARLHASGDANQRREYADLLARVHKKPGPWVYWGYRPPPRPPNTVSWQRTQAIKQELDRLLADPEREVRLAVMLFVHREKVPIRLDSLTAWLRSERDQKGVAAALESLREHPPRLTREALSSVIRERAHATANRLKALTSFADGLDASTGGQLLEIAGSLEDGPIVAVTLHYLAKWPKLASTPLLVGKVNSSDPVVRATALETLAELRAPVEASEVCRLLEDKDTRVRRAAASLAGILRVRAATEILLGWARHGDPSIRRAGLQALHQLREPRVVPLAVAALGDPETQVVALKCLGDLGGPDQINPVIDCGLRNPSTEILPLVVRLLNQWKNRSPAKQAELDRAVARLQGTSGVLLHWQALGPVAQSAAERLVKQFAPPDGSEKAGIPGILWKTEITSGLEARVSFRSDDALRDKPVWLAYADADVPSPTMAQFLASSNGSLSIWLNGQAVLQQDGVRPSPSGLSRFEGTLAKGSNRILVQVSSPGKNPEFEMHFRRKSSTVEHERLMQAALARSGDPEHGRQLFFDAAKSQCIKCHRIGADGERIGPELTGVGKRFSRIYLIESILEPSRTIAPSFETLVVALKDGRLFRGTKVAETNETLTLGDNQGQKHVLAKANIEETHTQPQSTMPDGLEKPLTTEEFVDLIAFLVSQK